MTTKSGNYRPSHPGVLLIGHGTRDEVGTDQFFQLRGKLAQRLSSHRVAAAFLEFQQPTVPEAWDSLVSQGVDHIHVAPVLLFAAGHAKQDIPSIIAACRLHNPAVGVDQSRPLSRHPAMVELVVRRLHETLAEMDTPESRTAVVMVGRGNHDPCAQADMRVLSEVVARRLNTANLFTAFYAMAEPRLPVVLEQIAASGRFDSVVVHPHLLFAGRLHQAIVRQTEDAARNHAGVRWRTSSYLGPDAWVADAIAGRIESISGQRGFTSERC